MNGKWVRQLFRRQILAIFLLVAQAAFLINPLVRGGRSSKPLQYLQDTAGFPVYAHASVCCFSPCERLLAALGTG